MTGSHSLKASALNDHGKPKSSGSAMNSHKVYEYPRGITKVVKTSMSLACLDVAADMGLEGSVVVDRKPEVLELPEECVVELPDEGPVVDKFGVEGSAVVERKLEVLELPGNLELVELELVKLPADGAVVVVTPC